MMKDFRRMRLVPDYELRPPTEPGLEHLYGLSQNITKVLTNPAFGIDEKLLQYKGLLQNYLEHLGDLKKENENSFCSSVRKEQPASSTASSLLSSHSVAGLNVGNRNPDSDVNMFDPEFHLLPTNVEATGNAKIQTNQKPYGADKIIAEKQMHKKLKRKLVDQDHYNTGAERQMIEKRNKLSSQPVTSSVTTHHGHSAIDVVTRKRNYETANPVQLSHPDVRKKRRKRVPVELLKHQLKPILAVTSKARNGLIQNNKNSATLDSKINKQRRKRSYSVANPVELSHPVVRGKKRRLIPVDLAKYQLKPARSIVKARRKRSYIIANPVELSHPPVKPKVRKLVPVDLTLKQLKPLQGPKNRINGTHSTIAENKVNKYLRLGKRKLSANFDGPPRKISKRELANVQCKPGNAEIVWKRL